MTREEKIEYIKNQTQKVIDEETKAGRMTPEMYAYLVNLQINALLAVANAD